MFRGTIMSSCASAFANKVCTYRKIDRRIKNFPRDIYSIAFLHVVGERILKRIRVRVYESIAP